MEKMKIFLWNRKLWNRRKEKQFSIPFCDSAWLFLQLFILEMEKGLQNIKCLLFSARFLKQSAEGNKFSSFLSPFLGKTLKTKWNWKWEFSVFVWILLKDDTFVSFELCWEYYKLKWNDNFLIDLELMKWRKYLQTFIQ